MAGKVQKMNNMNKTNGSGRMKVSAENPATTHTLDR